MTLLNPGPSKGFLNMPKLPVAGFFVRLLAFAIDIILIIAFIHLLARNFPGLFYAIPEWAPYLTGGFAFLYFVSLNGPWGGGRTIGKTLLKLRVTDFQGNPPNWRQAILRTVILMPVFVTVPIAAAIVGNPDSIADDFSYSIVTNFFFIAVAVATALVVPFNPFKQGFHDFFSETLVHGNGGLDAKTFEELKSELGPGWKPFHRQPQYSGFATIVLVELLFVVMLYPGNYPDNLRREVQARFDLAALPGFQNSSLEIIYPTSNSVDDDTTLEDLSPGLNQEPTSDTLKVFLQVERVGPWPFDAATSAGETMTRAWVEQLHQTVMPTFVDARLKTAGKPFSDMVPILYENPVNYRVLLTEKVSLTPYPAVKRKAGEISLTLPPIIPLPSQPELVAPAN